jgi:hypothetical protein
MIRKMSLGFAIAITLQAPISHAQDRDMCPVLSMVIVHTQEGDDTATVTYKMYNPHKFDVDVTFQFPLTYVATTRFGRGMPFMADERPELRVVARPGQHEYQDRISLRQVAATGDRSGYGVHRGYRFIECFRS